MNGPDTALFCVLLTKTKLFSFQSEKDTGCSTPNFNAKLPLNILIHCSRSGVSGLCQFLIITLLPAVNRTLFSSFLVDTFSRSTQKYKSFTSVGILYPKIFFETKHICPQNIWILGSDQKIGVDVSTLSPTL